jgi:hypothetical protein
MKRYYERRGTMLRSKTAQTCTRKSHSVMRDSPKKGFKMKLGMIGLLCISVIAMLGTEANACATGYRLIAGYCVKSGSVIIEAEVNHTGSLKQHPKSFQGDVCDPDNPDPEGLCTQGGVLFCWNKAHNQPPGQRIIPVVLPLKCDVPVQNVISSDNGGTASVSCPAKPTFDQLRSLDPYCSSGQEAIDFVPCAHRLVLTYTDDETSTVLERVNSDCTLPDCETLKWDKTNKRPENRPYECTTEPPSP